MTKIIVLGANLKDDQKARLEAFGEVKYLPSPLSSQELLKQVEGANILYSDGAFLLDSLPKLKNIFVTYPYIELGVFDSEELKKNGVLVANAQGGNRPSIIEWVMFMVLFPSGWVICLMFRLRAIRCGTGNTKKSGE